MRAGSLGPVRAVLPEADQAEHAAPASRPGPGPGVGPRPGSGVGERGQTCPGVLHVLRSPHASRREARSAHGFEGAPEL